MVVVALLQPPSWQMHFDPRPGVQSAVGGANTFVCLSVGVCALCPIMSVCVCVCAIMRSAIHGVGARTNAHNTISAAAPEETAHVYGSGYRSGTRFPRGFCLEFLSRSLWHVFPKEHTSPFVPLARVFCPYLTIAAAWKRFPGARNKSDSVSRLSFEMVLAEGRRPVISQFSC